MGPGSAARHATKSGALRGMRGTASYSSSPHRSSEFAGRLNISIFKSLL
jgi:hypothetical protein